MNRLDSWQAAMPSIFKIADDAQQEGLATSRFADDQRHQQRHQRIDNQSRNHGSSSTSCNSVVMSDTSTSSFLDTVSTVIPIGTGLPAPAVPMFAPIATSVS